MMLVMITVLGPPTARLLNLAGLKEHFLAVQTCVTAVFVLRCILADWIRQRTLHPIYAVGGTLGLKSDACRPIICRIRRALGWAYGLETYCARLISSNTHSEKSAESDASRATALASR